MMQQDDPAEIEAMAKDYAASPFNFFKLETTQVVAALHEYWSNRDEAMRLFGPRGALAAAEAQASEEKTPA
jgi:hypothetical protein